MKVVISNKAYFKLENPKDWDEIRSKLTYEVMDPNSQYPKIYQNCGRVNDMYWIPITRVNDVLGSKYTLEIIDKRVCPDVEIPEPQFTLRTDQQEIFDKFIHSGIDYCIVNGKPGFGKTISALMMAYALQTKTLVVCTNVNIRTMWEQEVERWFGFKPGVIGSGLFETDPPIVIANIQTLVKHSDRISDLFGLVIVDEMHHCVASTFTSVMEFTKAKYRIGLSGTLKRKDGLQVMFPDYFGYTVYSPEVSNTLPPTIYSFSLPNVELSGDRNIPWATRANEVYYNPEYMMHIASKAYVMYREGHKVLMVSDRTDFIEKFLDKMESVGVKTHKIVGLTEVDERLVILQEIEDDPSPCILAASVGIFSEGVSCNPLSCLIAGSIIGNNESLVEQLAGRIQRISDGKLPPVIIDTRLGGDTAFRQAASRKRVYNFNGWPIKNFTDQSWDLYAKKVLDSSQ